MKLQEGDRAPNFKGVTQEGKTISLADYKGKKLVLYFYPKDHTSGCTKQACNLRDNYGSLQQKGYAIVGVSNDTVDSHKRFNEKNKLPFPLIADTDAKIADAYGTSRLLWFPRRTTFIINKQGYIEKIIRSVDTSNHADEIIAEQKR